MSLSFAPIDPCGNSVLSMYNNVNDAYTYSVSNTKVDVLTLYNEELERRKKSLMKNDENIDKEINKNELEDLNFLQNVIKIKSKISKLKDEHKSLFKKLDCLEKDIKNVEDMKSVYENFSASYLSILNKEGSREIMVDLLNTIDAKYIEKDELDKKINDVLLEISFLKNLIRVDNVDNEIDVPVVDTEANPALLCFTCHESQITHCFSPCGHSFCEKCVSRINMYSNNAICFMCRGKVSGKIKLFFS